MSDQGNTFEHNSVQETLVLPLYGKAWCVKTYPDLFFDTDSVQVLEKLQYDFSTLDQEIHGLTGKIGALSSGLRQYSVVEELKIYLKDHPKAAVVNMGCGLDTAGHQADNGTCVFYNIDMPDVIAVRKSFFPDGEREHNIASDLTDFTWFDAIDASNGAVFFATGVFLYFDKSKVKELFCAMAERFPGCRIVFDGENEKGVSMDKSIIEKAGMTITTPFGLDDPVTELSSWSDRFQVTWKGLMAAHRKIDKRFGVVFRIMAWYADKTGMSQLDIIDFKA